MSKRIVVFGAAGQVGRLLLKELVDFNHKPTAVVRTVEQQQSVSLIHKDISSLKLSLDNATVKDLTNVIKGHDAVIFAAGSRGTNLLQVDLDCAVKTFEATREANIQRLILLSAMHTEDRVWIEGSEIRNYYIAKHYADRILVNEFQDLDFTIIKPTILRNNSGTGKIRMVDGFEREESTIDRIDVARVIAHCLDNSKTFGKVYSIAHGDYDLTDSSIY